MATDNIFKNGCIRGLVESRNTLTERIRTFFFPPKDIFLTQKNITTLAAAIGLYLHQTQGKQCHILIGTDTRPSRLWIKKALKSLYYFGHHIYDTGIVPTPVVAWNLKHRKDETTQEPFFDFGIIITASHNPKQYNGLKFITPRGYLSLDEQQDISEIFHYLKEHPSVISAAAHDFPSGSQSYFDAATAYGQALLEDQAPLIHMKKNKIVIDCANGATSYLAPKIFETLFDNVIMINAQGDGKQINQQAGCSNPQLLLQALDDHKAQWGCAFDGDGDRVIIAHRSGKIFDGDSIVAVLSHHPKFATQTTIIGTIMTNSALEPYFVKQQKKLLRTDVGECHIIQALEQHQAQLGSETCGHITIKDHALCSDGIYAACKFFEAIENGPSILDTLPQLYPQLHYAIPLQELNLDQEQIAAYLTTMTEALLPGRIIARASNTEPVFRVMVEHPDKQQAHLYLNTLVHIIAKPTYTQKEPKL